MKAPMVHIGRYLVCRIIFDPIVMVGVNILVEDVTGMALNLYVAYMKFNLR